ncbi:DUF6668 family protein [Crystallibacter degradans]|uniref:DUF6668 family protein n=1 Tax=Crystallibacter degradans TaxID=2726743 RepID=UPI0014759107|nr:DUF6668 family protein [Arthrobacter sp. SF27]NMR32313.1 hypothetical protein [Arthrobacter sp. SF27]
MQQSLNPWITSEAGPDNASEKAPETYVPPPAVISAPLRGMVEPDTADRLPRRTMTGPATLWITGAHGGAGENTIAGLLDGARATGHGWPVLDDDQRKPAVLLVCRSDTRGLKAAQSALIQWASGAAPAVDLLGLAVLADAPGKLPKALKEFAFLVGGGAPRLWILPWVEAWRHGDVTADMPSREYQRFATDLISLTNQPPTTPQQH